jgi:hypothetical protein
MLCYHGSTMRKRAGTTEKISVSLDREDLKALKQRAKRLYDGNVSAVIAELAADARLLEGMHDLVEWLGGPSLTDEDRKRIDREWRPQAPARKRKSKPEKAA